jgi:hypothetical protein
MVYQVMLIPVCIAHAVALPEEVRAKADSSNIERAAERDIDALLNCPIYPTEVPHMSERP